MKVNNICGICSIKISAELFFLI